MSYDQISEAHALAAIYLTAIVDAHPFLQGNKRTAATSCLLFLFYNGWMFQPEDDGSLAALVLGYVQRDVKSDQIAEWLKTFTVRREA